MKKNGKRDLDRRKGKDDMRTQTNGCQISLMTT